MQRDFSNSTRNLCITIIARCEDKRRTFPLTLFVFGGTVSSPWTMVHENIILRSNAKPGCHRLVRARTCSTPSPYAPGPSRRPVILQAIGLVSLTQTGTCEKTRESVNREKKAKRQRASLEANPPAVLNPHFNERSVYTHTTVDGD